MTLPVLAIVGRPNVGKSTIFNKLTRSMQALVSDFPGLTRDRLYGRYSRDDYAFWIIDTGGIMGFGETNQLLQNLMLDQVKQALQEADGILLVVDAKAGIQPDDFRITEILRRYEKPIWLLVNKVDNSKQLWDAQVFFELGVGEPFFVSALQGAFGGLIDSISNKFPKSTDELEILSGIRVALIGRPNVGKSTLTNTFLGEERVIVSDIPGTTRDSIEIPFKHEGSEYLLIDTAGVRRKTKITDKIEKFSVIKTLKSIEKSQVVVLLLDALEGIVEQDLHLLGHVIAAGKSFLIAVNKWDSLNQTEKTKIKNDLERRLGFASFSETYFISAKKGIRVRAVLGGVKKAFLAATQPIATSDLTRILERAIQEHQPPLVKGRRIKLRYAHVGGHNPPVIVIHGNQTTLLPEAYQRFLKNHFREALKLVGTPVHLELKESLNPFKGRKNTLNARQVQKKRRLMKFVKGKR